MSKKKAFLICLPMIVLFTTPWLHKALFVNMQAAGIIKDEDTMHVTIWVACIVAAFVSFFIAVEIKE